MKAKLLDIHGKEKSQIDLPKCFSVKPREDVVAKVLETRKTKQPYGSSPRAGARSASGNLVHRRHVWKSQYGRGMSRVPRKAMSRRGTQFNWVAAVAPNTRGGRRAHPPKPISMINTLKINKKELQLAMFSALSATTNSKLIIKRYATLNKVDQKFPLVVESKLISLKAKDFLKSIQEILGKDLFNLLIKKKVQRAGIGKMRGRKYKSNAGLLLIQGEKENLKSKQIEVVKVNELGVNDLARGGLGRITIYTEEAIKFLGGKKEKAPKKKPQIKKERKVKKKIIKKKSTKKKMEKKIKEKKK